MRSVEGLCSQIVVSNATIVDMEREDDKSDEVRNRRRGLEHMIKLLRSAIESTLWVVWKHVEHYSNCAADSLDAEFNAQLFKRELGILCGDEVFIQLLDVDKLCGAKFATGVDGFIDTLVRRLKRMTAVGAV